MHCRHGDEGPPHGLRSINFSLGGQRPRPERVGFGHQALCVMKVVLMNISRGALAAVAGFAGLRKATDRPAGEPSPASAGTA